MDRVAKKGVHHQQRKLKNDPLVNLIWKLAGFTLFVLLLFFAWNYYVEFQKEAFRKQIEASLPKPQINLGKKAPDGWEMYVISDYDFALPVPRFLSKNELENQGGYEKFIRLVKTDFSQGEGIAIGANKASLQNEKSRVLESLLKEVETEVTESEKNIENVKIIRVDIEVDKEGFESRSFLFYERDGKTISISSTPEQIDTILDLITFVRV